MNIVISFFCPEMFRKSHFLPYRLTEGLKQLAFCLFLVLALKGIGYKWSKDSPRDFITFINDSSIICDFSMLNSQPVLDLFARVPMSAASSHLPLPSAPWGFSHHPPVPQPGRAMQTSWRRNVGKI